MERPPLLYSDAWAKAVDQGRWPGQMRPFTNYSLGRWANDSGSGSRSAAASRDHWVQCWTLAMTWGEIGGVGGRTICMGSEVRQALPCHPPEANL